MRGALPAPAAAFLNEPDLPGPWGALLDECARAAADLCRVVEAMPLDVFTATRPGPDEHTASPRAICLHVVGAARRYADYVRKALGLPHVDRFVLPDAAIAKPSDLRPHLAEALRYTEASVAPMRGWPEAKVEALKFQVRWGPTYDPEMILEHGVCHLLRHRRQLERW